MIEYFRKACGYIGRTAKKALVVGSALLALNSPGQANEAYRTETPTTYIVRKDDNLTKIAQERLGGSATPREIYDETNRLAKLNGKGSLEEYPWNDNYDFSNTDERDPNLIRPGDELKLEERIPSIMRRDTYPLVWEDEYFTWVRDSIPPPESGSEEDTYPLWPFAVGAGAAGYLVGRLRKKKHYLEELVEFRNENEFKSIDNLLYDHNGKEMNGRDISVGLMKYMGMYRNNRKRFKTRISRYDSSIATDEMKEDMVERYQNSEESLEEVAEQISEEHGMNVSSSTISRYAREELDVDSREEAKEVKRKT